MSKQRPTPKTAPKPSAARRRSTNGLLLVVAVAAAVGITILANYVVYWQYRGLSPDARRYVRYDLTSTRRYSLSPQTRGVIDSLDSDYRLVTMLGGESINSDQSQRVRDLVDEYARASTHLTIEHIDLDHNADARRELLAEMDAMFANDTADIRKAISDGIERVTRYSKAIDTIEAGLKKIIDNNVPIRPEAIQVQRLTDLHSQYVRLQDRVRKINEMRDAILGKDWAERLTKPGAVQHDKKAGENLPDYTSLMSAIQQYVVELTRNTLPDTPLKADQLRRGIANDPLAKPETQQAALEAQNTLAALVQQVPDLLKQMRAETDTLLKVAAPLRYETARSVLNDRPCVLMTSGGDARVIPADLLFRGTGTSEDGTTSDLFVGEEQLTGALISMTLDPPPLVVFIRSNTGFRALSVTGGESERLEGIYDHAAQRLLAMDFEVTEWGNPLTEEPPQARPNQKTVWITLPYLKPDINRKQSLDNTRKDKVTAFLEKRLAAGDSAMVMLSYNPETDPQLKLDKPDTLIELLKGLGIDAQVYQNAARLAEESEQPGASKYSSDFLIRDWPESAIVGRSLEGIDTYFFAPMPLALDPVDGVKQTPLVELTYPAMYVQRTVPDRETGAFEVEPGSERPRVLIGAAAERGPSRVITIGDATWALDNVTTLATRPDGKTAPEQAEIPGARLTYPGNTDLFVNCVCWLAHADELIAASPRVQDVRRIAPMSTGTLNTYRVALWGGMPCLIFACGVIVWLMRRRA